jgi:hypothetical protein
MNVSERYATANAMIMDVMSKCVDREFVRPKWLSTPFIFDKNFVGYGPDQIEFRWWNEKNSQPLDSKYMEIYQGSATEHVQHLLKEKKIWENTIYALKDVTAYRSSGEEVPELLVYVQKNLYTHSRTMLNVYQTLVEEQNDELFSNAMQDFSNWNWFSCSLGTQIAVITTDNKIIFARRSLKVTPGGHMYQCTAVETVDVRDADENGLPNIWKASARALKEETGIEFSNADVYKICITGLMCRKDFMAGFVGFVDLSTTDVGMNSKEVMENFVTGKGVDTQLESDKWEAVEFNPSSVFEFMNQNRISPLAVHCAILALKNRYGEAHVDEELLKYYHDDRNRTSSSSGASKSFDTSTATTLI